MDGFTGLLEGFGVLAAAFGGLIWADRRARAEPLRERHPRLPPRREEGGVPPEVLRPQKRASEIRDHLYGEGTKVSGETGVLSTRRVPGGTRRDALLEDEPG